MDTKPRYLTPPAIAGALGLADRRAVYSVLVRSPDLVPRPDAWVSSPRENDGITPAWLESRLPEWERCLAAAAEREPETPCYITSGHVARHVGVGRPAVANWLVRHAETIPQPDAWVTLKGQAFSPVWAESRLPEWGRWVAAGPAPTWVRESDA